MISSVRFKNIKYIHNAANHYHYPFPELCSSSKQKLYPLNNYTPFPLPPSLATTFPSSVSMSLISLDTTCK